MTHDTDDNFAGQNFSERLVSVLAIPGTWRDQARIVVESWVRLAEATAAILLSAAGPESLEIVACRSNDQGFPHTSVQTVDETFAVLLDSGQVADVLASAGVLGGLSVKIVPLIDLQACLVIQHADSVDLLETSPAAELLATARHLLSAARDRPVLMPDPELLEAMAEFAAGAGHEINNPLASIIGQTQLLIRQEQSTDRRQALETIGAQAWRIRDMIGNSMLFARPPVATKRPLNLVEVAQLAIAPLTAEAEEDDVEIRLASTSTDLRIDADQTQLSLLLSQLVRNSLEAIRGAGRSGLISVTLRDDAPGAVEVAVTDNGPGITSESARRHLFHPFYSGRSAGRGLGFGLCLAWRIVQMHGGLILHSTPESGGCAIHIALPRP